MMNKWIELSIESANQRSYLDDLFQVYPTIPEGIRWINKELLNEIENSFNKNFKINCYNFIKDMKK